MLQLAGVHLSIEGNSGWLGDPAAIRAIVVVIPLLLVIAGDVETNPGPGGKYCSGEEELVQQDAINYNVHFNYTKVWVTIASDGTIVHQSATF